jgi:NAD(P)-dependent dehydrogenase (short-subunit alcohol dehydrogenase family)
MIIFLTGGRGGIGSTISKALKQAGINVIEPTSKELDLNSNFKVNYKVEGFIHCAGVNNIKKHSDVTSEEFTNLFNINTFSFIKLCGQLKFTPGSNIIAIGSLYATNTKENRIQYAMSKHAMYGAVKTLALEKSSEGIKVNMVSPGFVDTKMTRKNNSSDRLNYLEKNIPLGLTDAWEIANLCVYLIKNNRAITGQNILVDSGASLKGI